ncbi:hypothetical protein L7F22_045098 [Adiantum nelumboides]|nr:hypothetical protein [Adiantum nelumboides]
MVTIRRLYIDVGQILMLDRPSPSQIKEAFEVLGAKNGTLLVAVLHLLSRFFGFYALTWAIVVLLGGFASTLCTLDFFLVLVKSARLFIVQVFSKILKKTFFRKSHHLEDFVFKDMQYSTTNCMEMVGQVVSGILASASFIALFLICACCGRLHFDQTKFPHGLS